MPYLPLLYRCGDKLGYSYSDYGGSQLRTSDGGETARRKIVHTDHWRVSTIKIRIWWFHGLKRNWPYSKVLEANFQNQHRFGWQQGHNGVCGVEGSEASRFNDSTNDGERIDQWGTPKGAIWLRDRQTSIWGRNEENESHEPKTVRRDKKMERASRNARGSTAQGVHRLWQSQGG